MSALKKYDPYSVDSPIRRRVETLDYQIEEAKRQGNPSSYWRVMAERAALIADNCRTSKDRKIWNDKYITYHYNYENNKPIDFGGKSMSGRSVKSNLSHTVATATAGYLGETEEMKLRSFIGSRGEIYSALTAVPPNLDFEIVVAPDFGWNITLKFSVVPETDGVEWGYAAGSELVAVNVESSNSKIASETNSFDEWKDFVKWVVDLVKKAAGFAGAGSRGKSVALKASAEDAVIDEGLTLILSFTDDYSPDPSEWDDEEKPALEDMNSYEGSFKYYERKFSNTFYKTRDRFNGAVEKGIDALNKISANINYINYDRAAIDGAGHPDTAIELGGGYDPDYVIDSSLEDMHKEIKTIYGLLTELKDALLSIRASLSGNAGGATMSVRAYFSHHNSEVDWERVDEGEYYISRETDEVFEGEVAAQDAAEEADGAYSHNFKVKKLGRFAVIVDQPNDDDMLEVFILRLKWGESKSGPVEGDFVESFAKYDDAVTLATEHAEKLSKEKPGFEIKVVDIEGEVLKTFKPNAGKSIRSGLNDNIARAAEMIGKGKKGVIAFCETVLQAIERGDTEGAENALRKAQGFLATHTLMGGMNDFNSKVSPVLDRASAALGMNRVDQAKKELESVIDGSMKEVRSYPAKSVNGELGNLLNTGTAVYMKGFDDEDYGTVEEVNLRGFTVVLDSTGERVDYEWDEVYGFEQNREGIIEIELDNEY